jgi:hypothetical protein
MHPWATSKRRNRMIERNYNRERLESLLFASVNEAFSPAEREELNAILRGSAEARKFAAQFLTIDAVLAETLAASRVAELYTQPVEPVLPKPIQFASTRPGWLSRAASWASGFSLFGGNFAHAASKAATGLLPKASYSIFMTKTTITIAGAILILGGSTLTVLHHKNNQTSARVAQLEVESNALRRELGLSPNSEHTGANGSNGASGRPAATSRITIPLLMAIHGKSRLTMEEGMALRAFEDQLASMDAESTKQLILEAETIGEVPSRFYEQLLKALIKKDPAVATSLATRLALASPQFDWLVSSCSAEAFKQWLAIDFAAAEAWYATTAAAGGLYGKSIPANGLEKSAVDRSLPMALFAAALRSNPQAAETMLAGLLPEDVTLAMQDIKEPSIVERILPKLSPDQRRRAASATIKELGAKDFDAAIAWANSLNLGSQQDVLAADAVIAAHSHGKLALNDVAQWSKTLNISDKERGDMLGEAARHASTVNKQVVWANVAENCNWLRESAPQGVAGEQVGRLLGLLALNRLEVSAAVKAYEQEQARQNTPDPSLAITFARYLGQGSHSTCTTEALKILDTLPPSPERDDARSVIELNRR